MKPNSVSKVKNNSTNGNGHAWTLMYKGKTAADIRRGFLSNLEYEIAKDQYAHTPYDRFLSLAYTVRDRLVERWIMSRSSTTPPMSSGSTTSPWNSFWAGY